MTNTAPGPGPQMSQTRHPGGRVVTIGRQRYLRDGLGRCYAPAQGKGSGPGTRQARRIVSQEDKAASRTGREPAGTRYAGIPLYLIPAHALMEAR
jgi:hypothetical protein